MWRQNRRIRYLCLARFRERGRLPLYLSDSETDIQYSVLLHSSDGLGAKDADVAGDPNSYRPFKLVDSVIARSIEREMEGYEMDDNERARLS